MAWAAPGACARCWRCPTLASRPQSRACAFPIRSGLPPATTRAARAFARWQRSASAASRSARCRSIRRTAIPGRGCGGCRRTARCWCTTACRTTARAAVAERVKDLHLPVPLGINIAVTNRGRRRAAARRGRDRRRIRGRCAAARAACRLPDAQSELPQHRGRPRFLPRRRAYRTVSGRAWAARASPAGVREGVIVWRHRSGRARARGGGGSSVRRRASCSTRCRASRTA